MQNKRVIPFLMLHKGLLYKSIGFANNRYIGEPMIAVKIFNEKSAHEICIVDSDLARNKGRSIQFDLLSNIASECFMPLSYGGGVRSLEDIGRLNRIGFEKVILGSVLHEDEKLVSSAVKEFGSSTIIGCVDYKFVDGDYYVFKDGGNVNTGKKIFDIVRLFERLGVGEIMLNDIDGDGNMRGLNCNVIKRAAGLVSIPIIASGGVNDLNSIQDGFNAGANAVAASSMFVFLGRLKAVLINYPEAVQLNKKLSLG